ncbi:MAG: ParB N-terminal domain-containing protein [Desulfobacterales bacterium]|uniref:ParB N-terminal domain-containing protein n=1 Tax=Candidatus Desulfatibia vada TaxID=2841696 RepID=A0A8J6P701_9BACT|nr:ParB N-terminal domain-containing protein [Candidatus Desulfatibia vada]
MTKSTTKIPIASIIFEEEIYPRKGIDHRRFGIFAENIRDGFKFEPIEVEPHPDKPGKYRLLDGVHRWSAYKTVGMMDLEAIIKDLKGSDPLLYAAKKAIGPKQLTEDEARDTARRVYNKNTSLSSADIGKAIGRSRQTVDSYIADLRAATQMGLDIKMFRMNRLGIPQDRMAKRLGVKQVLIHNHLLKMPVLANSINTDLSRGFTVSQVAEKHNWTEPMVWSLALEDKEDLERFKELGWGLRTWDKWEWHDCDKRFGDDWPGRIPAQLIAHILYYFSKQNNLIFDPMAGGGVTPDTCLALSRRCWAFDMQDQPETRPEIEPHTWTHSTTNPLAWPVSSKEKPDLIICDPPYFDKKAADYDKKSISGLPKKEYLEFLEAFFALLKQDAKKTTRLAFINADWRDFQNKPAAEESGKGAILIDDYLRILNKTGWRHTHIIQAPMSAQRFSAVVVSAMQKKRILGVTSRYVIILKQ